MARNFGVSRFLAQICLLAWHVLFRLGTQAGRDWVCASVAAKRAGLPVTQRKLRNCDTRRACYAARAHSCAIQMTIKSVPRKFNLPSSCCRHHRHLHRNLRRLCHSDCSLGCNIGFRERERERERRIIWAPKFNYPPLCALSFPLIRIVSRRQVIATDCNLQPWRKMMKNTELREVKVDAIIRRIQATFSNSSLINTTAEQRRFMRANTMRLQIVTLIERV